MGFILPRLPVSGIRMLLKLFGMASQLIEKLTVITSECIRQQEKTFDTQVIDASFEPAEGREMNVG
jgi:hypothetical protein